MAKFVTPVIQDNPSGWGPCAVPEQFRDMPYQPFSKGDRLGKVADWTGATYQDKRYTNKYSSQFGGGSQYAYFHEEDETSFQLVDTARTQKTAYQRNRMRFAQRNLRRDKDRRNMLQFSMQTLPKSAKQKERDRLRLQKKFQKQFGVRQKWDQKSQKPRDSSVEVRSDWEVKEEMDFPRLMKMRYLEVSEPQDIECCGALEYYDKAFDRITTRNEKLLRSIKRIFHTVTTTDDPVIRKLAKTQGNVFATDAILATLMSCTRSVYSWDIIVQRVGSKLFFDKRDNSDFDLLTVSETANEPPQEEGNSFNSPRNLAMEATYINHNFSQQCLRMGKEKYKFPNPNPFVEDDMDKNEVASVAYRYRRWKLGDDIDLIVRCEHDGVMTGANGEVSFINIKTLNEWDSRYCNGVDWRQKLDSQRGAVIATELKNNSYKLARWTCCALLAGSEYLKLGYVSRYHVKDSARHVILGTQQFKPNEFASQINLSIENAWGILRCVIDICMKLDEGKYLILKDPNKQVIRIYSLPDGTFSSDEDEEDEEEEEEEQQQLERGQGEKESLTPKKILDSQDSTPVPSPPVDVATFLAFPSPEKLLRLGPKCSVLIAQQTDASDVEKVVTTLLRISSVFKDEAPVKTAVHETTDALMKKAFTSATFNSDAFITSLLIHMGLLKSEEKIKAVPSLYGILMTLNHMVQQDYFPKSLAPVLSAFVTKPNRALDSCSFARHMLLQTLHQL